MKNAIWKKGLVAGIMFSFVGISVISATSIAIEKCTIPYATLDGDTLYVGGSGPGNYTKIQDAIDDASDGYTVFVYSGTYYENVVVDRTILLIGENANTAIIDGSESSDVIYLATDNVTVSGFTIRSSGSNENDAGIDIRSDYNTINGNIIKNNGGLSWTRGGILMINSSYNDISNNSICSNNMEGIHMCQADYNIIHNNKIYDNGYFGIVFNVSSHNAILDNDMFENYVCMSLWPFSHDNEIIGNAIHDHEYYSLSFYSLSNNNTVRYNNFTDNLEWSIKIAGANNNLIEYNSISGSSGGSWGFGVGVILYYAFQNTIRNNNIMRSKDNSMVENSFFNRWTSNYWDDYTGFGPKVIWGKITFPQIPDFHIPWFTFDWHPADEPYDVPIGVI